MKLIILTLLLLTLGNTSANEEILIVRECDPIESSCDLFSDYDLSTTKKHHGSIGDRLTITYGEIKSATINEANGATVISITLDKKVSSSLEALTEKSLNKRIFIIVENTVLSMPLVREKIKGGVFQISLPKNDSNFREKLKWLNPLIKMTKDREIKSKETEVTRYLLVTGALFFLAGIYAFLPRGQKKGKPSPFSKNSPTVGANHNLQVRPIDHARTEYDPNYNQVIEEDLSDLEKGKPQK